MSLEKNDWIKISDRLPAAGETVFYVRSGAIRFGRFQANPMRFETPYTDGGQSGINVWNATRVTHWMPCQMPELPVN